jgi:cobalt-zinc-cadmium efflux system protein
MAADAAVSVGVVVAGLAIMATGLAWIDPLVSIVIMAVIVWGTWDLFTESIGLAMDAVPRRIDLDKLTAALAEIAGVSEVHDLHVWSTSTSEVILTAHLVVPEGDQQAVLAAARGLLAEQFTIAHVTLQLEGEAVATGCLQRDADSL